MQMNQEAAEQLVRYGFPIMWAWLYIGFVISLLYHLSLYYLDGEFRISSERSLDIFVSILRGLLYILVWPGIFVFDTTALQRIKLFFVYLNPKERETDWELQMYLKEREYRRWVARWYVEQSDVDEQRKKETATGQERIDRLKVLHEGNSELDRIWLMTGVGSNPAGVRELVRLYPDYHLPDDVAAKARQEVQLRRPWACLRCSTVVEPEKVELPELLFLRVTEQDTGKLVVEGWALEGDYRLSYAPCPRCGAEQPPMSEDLARFGQASEVVRQIRSGLTVHWDLP